MWKKAVAELQKIQDDPNKIKEYIATNTIPSIFKKEFDNFRTTKESKIYEADTPSTNNDNPTSTSSIDEKAFGLIDSILNKDTGAFGKQGIGMLFSDKSLQGDKMKVKRISFEFIINSARDQVIKKIKYDQKKNIQRSQDGTKFVDMNYLPSFKDMLLKTKNEPTAASENIETIIKWVTTNIQGDMTNIVKAVREDDIKSAVQKGGGSVTNNGYKPGDMVRYKMKDYEEGVEPDQQKDKIGTKQILKIEGDNFTFKDKDGKEFTKTKEQIIGKAEGNDNDGNGVVDKLKDKFFFNISIRLLRNKGFKFFIESCKILNSISSISFNVSKYFLYISRSFI